MATPVVDPARVLARLLIDGGLGLVSWTSTSKNWSVSVGYEPDTPDNHVTVISFGGRQQGRGHKTGERWVTSQVQVRLRSKDYGSADTKGRLIAAFLDGLHAEETADRTVEVDEETVTVHAVHITDELQKIGTEEERKREIFALSALITFD